MLEGLQRQKDATAGDCGDDQLAVWLVQQRRLAQELERALIERESKTQTELARHRWNDLRGAVGYQNDGKITQDPRPTCSALPCPPSMAAKVPKRRVPRPKLGRRIADAWSTSEGKRLLTGLSLRELKRHFGVNSHSSFYEVPLFNDTIRPLRQQAHRGQQAANWLERNARHRRPQ